MQFYYCISIYSEMSVSMWVSKGCRVYTSIHMTLCRSPKQDTSQDAEYKTNQHRRNAKHGKKHNSVSSRYIYNLNHPYSSQPAAIIHPYLSFYFTLISNEANGRRAKQGIKHCNI